ncbi:MAG: nucleotidyl transferase AbiEii/AbiGii toxin family protein [Bacteroidota bacterium]
MINKSYKDQVSLLISVIPEIARENCFALHGGTAINLFIRNMPRLSVDIDLTYIPIEDRATTFKNINDALARIKTHIEKVIPKVVISHKKAALKLLISAGGVLVKLEVSQINRGLLQAPLKMDLCEFAQDMFDAFCSISTMHSGQLYGGKICAALDRQHPRDLFDIKDLLDQGGITEDIKTGFLLCLLASARPIHELLSPNLLDQKIAMENQFLGMTEDDFTYEEYEQTRNVLIKSIGESLSVQDKKFLTSFVATQPDWTIHDFEKFPSVQWKLQNLQHLKENNPEKHGALLEALEEVLA